MVQYRIPAGRLSASRLLRSSADRFGQFESHPGCCCANRRIRAALSTRSDPAVSARQGGQGGSCRLGHAANGCSVVEAMSCDQRVAFRVEVTGPMGLRVRRAHLPDCARMRLAYSAFVPPNRDPARCFAPEPRLAPANQRRPAPRWPSSLIIAPDSSNPSGRQLFWRRGVCSPNHGP